MGCLSPASEPLVHGGIDVPDASAPIQREAMVVKGWALGISSPVSSVEVWLHDTLLGRAGLGRPRPDVAAALGHDDAELSGFELRQELAQLHSLGDLVLLRARVHLLDGTRAELPAVEARITPIPSASSPLRPEPASPGIDSRRSRPRASGAAPRILWFERTLGRGGSQLRLKELVEHLAKSESIESTVIVEAEGPLRRDLERAGAVVERCEGFPVDDIAAYERRMSTLMASTEGRCDLVVGHTLTSFPAIDLADRLGLPSIWRIGEAEPLSTVVGWLYGRLDPAVEAHARRAFGAASIVLFNSNAALRVQQTRGASGRFVVIQTGVDVTGAQAWAASRDRETCRRRLAISSRSRLLICAGSLWPVKGQALLVAALRHVRVRHGHLECVFIGEPTEPYAGALSRFIVSHGLADCVRMLPFVEDLRPWWRAADVAVCASESESLPASVLEAMAFGLPVLATRVGDLPELVEPGVTGWLCEPSDLGSLVARLEQVAMAAPHELRGLGAAAARRVKEAHDRDVVLPRTSDLVRDVARGAQRT